VEIFFAKILALENFTRAEKILSSAELINAAGVVQLIHEIVERSRQAPAAVVLLSSSPKARRSVDTISYFY
jgi:hypothetical protein